MSESPIPPAIAAVPSIPKPETDEVQAGSELSQRHQEYINRFRDWLLGLNKHDFLQAKKLLDNMMHVYAKHVMKIHSPPARTEQDVPGKTSAGPQSPDLPPSHEPGNGAA